jgi:hypothetical protein
MRVLNRLERRFGQCAVKDLMIYIIGFNLLVYLLSYAYPQSGLIGKLALDPFMIMQGQVWRLVTFVFIPPATSVLWIFVVLYFYYIVGMGLEHEWGSFRFNVYYLVGMAATIIAAFVIGQGATAFYLNLSLFLAFAHIYPDYQILLFFIIPVKVKYLAWLNWLYIGFTVLTAPFALKAAALASVANFFLFFGKEIFAGIEDRRSLYRRRRPFNAMPRSTTIHRCTVCGRTEKDDRALEFRYCSTCEGDYEYCSDHLKSHEHVKSGGQAGSGQ